MTARKRDSRFFVRYVGDNRKKYINIFPRTPKLSNMKVLSPKKMGQIAPILKMKGNGGFPR